ncbi:Na+/H+ antiporter [Asaia sp. W19]|uniref:Na+/H+ antiporter n=1 Tax=unclassified Asaia TaxID=2685023 RepID=UPI000F8E1C3B|nr:Na+/H+ antiporter [Asaia sp. W19]RUT24455.1 Na+/H+ antiporter [Asaia sp. W19]
MDQYLALVVLVAAILLLETGARRLRLPRAAVLIIGGAGLGMMPGIPAVKIEPGLVLAIFLPPLLTSGAWFTAWRDFRANLSGIVLLAVGAVAFTTFAVAWVLHCFVPTLPWAVCVAIGAIVAPPDAVAAEAVLAHVRLPGRVVALLQGESLLNDAAGLVLLRFAVAAALTGVVDPAKAAGTFAVLALGGIGFGLIMGNLWRLILRNLSDAGHAIAAMLVATAISYLGAEHLHLSGVLSTVTMGLVIGYHQHRDLSATIRIRAGGFWLALVFLMESLLFILIGLSLRGVIDRAHDTSDVLGDLLLPSLLIAATVIVTRFLWVFSSDVAWRLVRSFGFGRGRAPSLREATVMAWAGMRGAVTLLAALSLPETLPGRDLALASAFMVIVVTVLVQGATLAPLIRYLKLDSEAEIAAGIAAEGEAWVIMSQAQQESLKPVADEHPRLYEQYGRKLEASILSRDARDDTRGHEIAHFRTVLMVIAAGREAIVTLHRAGTLPDAILREMEYELDLQQMVAEARLID